MSAHPAHRPAAGPTAGATPRAPRHGLVSLPGMVLGTGLALLSTGPSLLPRSALEQGVLGGVCFGLGYLVGAVSGLLTTRLGRPPLVRAIVWVALALFAAVLLIPASQLWMDTQTDLHRAVLREPPTWGDGALALATTVAVASVLLLLGKGVTAARRRLARGIGRGAVGGGIAAVVVGVALLAVAGAAFGVAGWAAERSYSDRNATGGLDLPEPSSAYRSTGWGSALSWEDAGAEGRAILAGGPSADEIASVTGEPALEPVRVYVGLDEPGGWDEHAAAAVAELDRLGAANRSLVVVAATTGTGWLDPQAIDAVEYLNGGDTALVAMQYSVAESWQSYLFHPGNYRDATGALIDAVHAWWSALPADERPRLALYGLSLGSRAVQETFPDAGTMRGYGDGVILAGTPYGTAMNAELTAARDPGTSVGVPVLDGGREFRWFADGLDVQQAAGEWTPPRVAYLQHGNDPIVWAGPPVLWWPPEWLGEQRNPGLHPQMRWYPLVTGLQTMVDSLNDLSGPDGDGHRYGSTTLEAWIAVLGDHGYDADVLDAIRQRVAGDDLPAGGDV